MYYEHFGLNYPPFKITPDTQLFYAGGNRGLVLDALVYAIESGEGIIKVVGEVGSGKTMLCRMLEEKLKKYIEIVYLANPRLPPEMILHAIALEMRLPVTPESNRLQVMHDLHLKLLEKHASDQQVVVFIEEAQEMPLETLEEIRLLSNLETSRHKLLQLVLFGQPELDVNLSVSHIRQLKERITHNFYLTGFTRTDVAQYLDFRMRAAGYRGPSIFSKAAVATLTKVSKGLMRRINILADKALLAAFAQNKHYVTPQHVRLAARDSGFVEVTNFPRKMFEGGFLIAILLGLGLGWSYQQPLEYWSKQGITHPASTLPPPPSGMDPLLEQRLLASQQWLEKSTGFTLQVMQTPQTEDLINFLHKPEIQVLLDELYVHKTTRQWEVFYAQFADANTTVAAINNLPKGLQRNKPFLRKIEKIRMN